jgi:hypothetical protein
MLTATELRIPLLNARATAEPLDFGSGFAVRRASGDEKQRWAEDPFIRDVVPHRVFPEVQSVLVCKGRSSYDEDNQNFAEDLMAWFGLTSLWRARAIEAAFGELFPVGGTTRVGHARYLFFSLPVSEAPDWRGTIALDEELAGHLREQLPMFRSDHPFAGTFRYALARWFFSLNKTRRTKEDAVVDLSIALEALFVAEGELASAKLMRERLANYLSQVTGYSARPRYIKELVHEAYSVRSLIVHGRIVDEKSLGDAHRALDEIVRKVLADFVMGQLERFDPTSYWLVPPNSCQPSTDCG